MKVSSLVAILSNFEAAIAAAGNSRAPGAFKELGQLFVGHDEKNVVPYLNSLIKQRDLRSRGTNAPAITHILQALTRLEALLRSGEGKKGADDIAKLVELLDGCGHGSIGAFVNEEHRWSAE